MVRVRNLVLAIAAATALTSKAFALGLGEVKLQSSLNQPLVAEIELLDTKGLGMAEIIPGLASVEDFNKVGVDRAFFLNDLKFEPIKRPDGRPVVRVTSTQPVREPYLNFLVEVMWPNGRLLREYTLLLDPPLYSPETVARVAPQVPAVSRLSPPAPVAPAPTPGVRAASVAPSSAPAPSIPSTPTAPVAAAPTVPASADDTYRVTARDTLWEIAQRSRQGGSVHQAMLAIQDLNPDAFVDGNINRMKSGQVLRLPTAEQINSRTQSEALAAVAEQNAAWRQGRSVPAQAPATGTRQLDATRRESADAAPTRRDQQDSLRLVAGDSGRATEGSEKGSDSAESVTALKDRLALTQENLDSSRRENVELRERLEDLQAQLEKLQRLMQLKDDQLAQLQQQLAQAEGDGAGQAVAERSAQSPAAVVEPEPSNDTSVSSAADQRAVAPVVEPQSPVAPAASQPAAPAVAPAAKPEPVKPAPAPAPAAPVDEGLLGSLLANPLMLAAGGGVLVLLLAGLLIQSRRKAMAEDELDDELLADHPAEQAHATPFAVSPEIEAPAFDEPSTVADSQKPASDVLLEADTMIAYGRLPQAAELLQEAINSEPQRRDLRLKLLEVRAEMSDSHAFAREEAELREIGGSDAEIDKLKSRYPAIAGAALAGAGAMASEFDSLNFDLPADAESPAQAAEEEFDFSLDDLESQLGGFDEPAEQSASVSSEAQESDFSFDFQLGEAKAEEPSETLPGEDPFAGFDLGAELDSASGTVAESAEPASEVEESDFSFDLDSELASTDREEAVDSLDFDFAVSEESKPEAESALPMDFDLSLDDELPAGAGEDFAAQLGEMDAELEELARRVDEPAKELEFAASAPAQSSAAALGSGELDEDFGFLAGTDETTTKLDLARAYIEMGDADGARDILDEILSEGNESQRQEAREMLTTLS